MSLLIPCRNSKKTDPKTKIYREICTIVIGTGTVFCMAVERARRVEREVAICHASRVGDV